MSGFGRRVPSGRKIDGERRKKERDSVTLSGSLATSASSRSVVFVDVSPSGAKVRGENLPVIGHFVRLQIESEAIFGTVVWRQTEECGIRFDETLSESSLQKLDQAQREANEFELTACTNAMRTQLRNSR